MTLYELTEQGKALYRLLQEDEIDEQTYADTLQSIGIEDKLEDCVKVIRQLEADALAVKTEKDRLADKQKSIENNVVRLKERVLQYLDTTPTRSAKAGIFEVRQSESKSVDVFDLLLVPTEYLDYGEPKPKKAEIAKAIKGGTDVPGCTIKTKFNLKIK